MAQKRTVRRQQAPRGFGSRPARRVVGQQISTVEPCGLDCSQMLQAMECNGRHEEEIIFLSELESAMVVFAQELVKRIPVQHHEAIHEAVEHFSRRLQDLMS